MTAGTVIVIAKEPVPGRVKTRLQAEFTPDEAAALARASLADTLAAVRSHRCTAFVLALEGTPGPWLPTGFTVISQRGDGLDERLAAAFEDAYDGAPMVLVGMDTPQVTPELLGVDWTGYDAVLGLTEDGGYWCLGLREPDRRALIGVPMSTDHTGRDQLARLRASRVPGEATADTARHGHATRCGGDRGRLSRRCGCRGCIGDCSTRRIRRCCSRRHSADGAGSCYRHRWADRSVAVRGGPLAGAGRRGRSACVESLRGAGARHRLRPGADRDRAGRAGDPGDGCRHLRAGGLADDDREGRGTAPAGAGAAAGRGTLGQRRC